MAKANDKTMGPAARDSGKGSGSGAMTEERPDLVGENMVLSNRDKKLHSDSRGQDSKWLQTEQLHDHSANKDPGE
jgi:hypothetical protein